MMRRFFYCLLCGWIVCLSACSLAPKYSRPAMMIPQHYQEAGKWQRASPSLANTKRGPWWHMYHDPTLNILEEQVFPANQTLQLALAQYDEARATAAAARGLLFPLLTGVTEPQRIAGSGTVANIPTSRVYNDVPVGVEFSYEIDVWGRIRNFVKAAEDRQRASAADLAAVDLSLHAELASDYFTYRGDQEAQEILDKTVIVYKKALFLTRMRHSGGASPEADVDQAETQFKAAQTLATDARLRQALMAHAIAILVGTPPAAFTLPPTHARIRVIYLTATMPSTLLERRPDIAAAELRVQAANAQIGVARAAYFPDFSLLGTLGFESQSLAKLLEMPSLYWAIGPDATWILFNGGRTQALVEQAKAIYFENVAVYRQTVLTAFQQVEDNLVSMRRLDQEMITEAVAVKAANRAVVQAYYRYKGGIITFLDVVVTQNTALQTELDDVDIRTRRQNASVALIKALGGGWQEQRDPVVRG
jgi:NodT family efflux transporter outer membrane factor (OMF) lipoprotein